MTDPLTPYVALTAALTATLGSKKPRGSAPYHAKVSALFAGEVSLWIRH